MDGHRWTVVDGALLGLTIVAWGINYLFVRVGLLDATPLWLATLRAGTGLAALAAFLLWSPPAVRLVGRPRLVAMLLGVPNTALFLGLWFVAAGAVPAGQAAVLIYTFPLWVAVLSVPVLGVRLSPRAILAVGGGFAGVVLISQPWASAGSALPWLPVLELVAAAVSWAIATVLFQRQFSPDELASANGYQLLGGAAALIAVTAIAQPNHLPVETPVLWVAVAWLGVFGTAFAYAVWFYLLGRVPATTLSAYSFLVPLVALVASVVLLGERLDSVQAVGVVLVIASIIIVTQSRTPPARAAVGGAASAASASAGGVGAPAGLRR